jgi:hypothetical protein
VFKDKDLNICQDCYNVCLRCRAWFVIGENIDQKLCWKCLTQEEKDRQARPYHLIEDDQKGEINENDKRF